MDYHDGRPTVLVADDDANVRHLVVQMLANGKFATVEAGGAEDALSLVQECQGSLDLAIIDMVMPGMSGLDLASELDRQYPNLKILYISGYVGSLAAQALAHRSPECVLLKPFTEEALLARVRTLLQNAPPVSRATFG